MTQLTNSTDHDLKRAIDDELDWNPSVNSDHVAVTVVDGAVSLTGEVASYPEKVAVTSAALRVRGVLAVADDIVVRHRWTSRSDADIARDAATVLATTVGVPSQSIRAEVHDHVITLTGTVTWNHERTAARQAVQVLSGVTNVINRMTLKPLITISATEAKHSITSALVRNARVDARQISVTVIGTEIQLTGKVKSWPERHQAEHACWCTPGVSHVDNQITIASS